MRKEEGRTESIGRRGKNRTSREIVEATGGKDRTTRRRDKSCKKR